MTATRTYRGATAEQRRAVRRAALVSATLDLLHEGGLTAVGVRAVCTRSALTPRYFYENFVDIDELVIAAVDAAGDEVIRRAQAAVADAGPDPVAQVRAAVSVGYGTVADEPRLGSVFLFASAGQGAVRERRHDIVERYAEHVLASIEAVRGRLTAVFLMGGTFDVIEAALSGRVSLSRDEVVDALSVLWLSTLGLA